MKRTITVKEAIDQLKEYSENSKITINTKEDVKIIGFVFQNKNGSKQIADIEIIKN